MKKTIALLLLLCLTVLLVACAGKEKTVVEGDYHAEQTIGKNESRRKDGMTEKTLTLFGKERQFYYSNTTSVAGGIYEADFYHSIDSTFLKIRSDTGQILHFQTEPTFAKDYVSPVGEGSTEEEYLAYASAVILDLTGVSTEGWEATIGFGPTKYKTELADGTKYSVDKNGAMLSVSEEEYESMIGTGVTVIYRKKLGEYDRCDKMTVKMSSVGEVFLVNAENYDEWFAPFVSVTPDRARIVQEARKQASSATNNALGGNVEKIEMVVNRDTLWACVYILYSNGVASAGISVYVEVAKIAE